MGCIEGKVSVTGSQTFGPPVCASSDCVTEVGTAWDAPYHTERSVGTGGYVNHRYD